MDESLILQMHYSDVSPVLILRSLSLLGGLNTVVGPVPDIHICQRQSLFWPVFKIVLLHFGAYKDPPKIFTPAKSVFLTDDISFSETLVVRWIEDVPLRTHPIHLHKRDQSISALGLLFRRLTS